jgi:hypothetical protein
LIINSYGEDKLAKGTKIFAAEGRIQGLKVQKHPNMTCGRSLKLNVKGDSIQMILINEPFAGILHAMTIED